MSTYHCSVKIVSRSTGRSSVGAAAYRAGEKIKNEHDGITHDYTRKGGVVYSEILLPENAPIEYSERAVLWNAVEKSETRANSQTAREIEVALPRDLSYQEQANMVREYVKDNFVSRGMCADFAIHDKDKGNTNPHAHILLTMRSIDKNGKWEPKAKFVYELDKNGNKQYDPKTRKYRGHPENTNNWNRKENVEQWRESWAQMYNREMEKKSLPVRVDHRSYARQGIDKEPTIHRGPAAHHMEQRGTRSDRGDINRGIEARNRAYTLHISELREDVTAYTADGASLFPYGREAFSEYGIELPDAPPMGSVISYVEQREEKSREREYIEQEGKEQYRAIGTEQIQAEQERGYTEPPKEQERAASRGASDRESQPNEQARERERTTPDREKGRTEPPREERGQEPARASKMRVRGDIEERQGVALPLYVHAAREVQKCQQIDNPKTMERALATMRQEDIRSYTDHDIRLKEYRQAMDIGNVREAALTKEIEKIKETIVPLEIYERHLPQREEIEKAGIFQRGKLEKQYSLGMRALAGSEERLQRMGIDPKNMTAAQQKERVAELTQQKISIQREGDRVAGKSLKVKESQKMMKQLYIDRGIDHAKRARELARILEKGRELEIER